MDATLKAIEYCLPAQVLSNDALARAFPDWTPDRIEEITGIAERHIVAEHEYSSDLAVEAAQKLFASGACQPEEIDFILLCTQTPDYFMPTTACLLQDRLGVPKDAGALDFNLGCSGFVYGLGLAKGLIESGQARSVLLITADTISKLIHPEDKSVRLLFGDAGAATLVQGTSVGDVENFGSPLIGPFVFGTDGRGAENLIVRAGGTRKRCSGNGEGKADQTGNAFPSNCLYMNGPEIFTFTLQTVPQLLNQLLSRSGRKLQDIDLFVFHQANQFMLEQLRKKLNIPTEKFVIAMRHSGNTASATIPIALKCALQAGRLKAGALVMLAGFGVGYSWESTLVRWTTASEGEVGDCQHARTQQEPA